MAVGVLLPLLLSLAKQKAKPLRQAEDNAKRGASRDSYTESEKIYDTLLASFISITINQDMATRPQAVVGAGTASVAKASDSDSDSRHPAGEAPEYTHGLRICVLLGQIPYTEMHIYLFKS